MIHVFAFLMLAGIAYASMNEGIYGAIVLLTLTIMAGVLAMNFYEPIAQFCGDRHIPFAAFNRYSDAVVFLILFGGTLLGLRAFFEHSLTERVRFPVNVDRVGAIAIGLVNGILVVGALLFAAQMMPLDKDFLGYDKDKPVLGIAPDAVFLKTMHQMSGVVLDKPRHHMPAPIVIRDRYFDFRG